MPCLLIHCKGLVSSAL